MDEREWFFAEGPSQMGPVTRQELGDALSRLPAGTLVWRGGMANWTAAESVPELADLVRRPTPPPPPPPPAAAYAPPPYTPPAGGYAPPAPGGYAPPPAGGYRPPSAYRPSGPPAAAPTLNPLVLWREPWSGRFTRGQFAVAYFGAGFLSFVVAIFVAIVSAMAGEKSPITLIATIVFMLVALVNTVAAIGAVVRRLHDLGHSGFLALVMVLPCINLMLLIYLLVAPGQTEQSSGGSNTTTLVVIAVALAVLAIPAIGIIAAIAIPSLLRARISANEASAIGDVRTVISAQAAYQATHKGSLYAGRPDCLFRPATCMPGYDGPTFVDAQLFQSPRSGYTRELIGNGTDPNVAEFAFIAIPAQEGKTGIRSFCGDATGQVCSMMVGMRAAMVESTAAGTKCSSTCTPLR